jgi:hypothetical protein
MLCPSKNRGPVLQASVARSVGDVVSESIEHSREVFKPDFGRRTRTRKIELSHDVHKGPITMPFCTVIDLDQIGNHDLSAIR